MDLFAKCKELYEKIRYFEYGIPVDGVIKSVPSAEYYVKNYHFLKPEEFEKYGGGICWDYVEYERKFLEVNDIDFNQYYIITNTPPNYDTHTFVTVKDGDDLIYIESSFKRVEHIIDGVQKFKSLEDIVKLITTNMWECNGNDKRFDEFKYDVCKFKGHPQYGCTCEEYMKWMDDNSDIVIQDVSINPKKINEDELTVESCNFFQEGLFNFGKPKEPVDVMAKLSETFGELSPAQRSIISTNKHSNTEHPFFEKYSKHMYENIAPMRGFLDRLLKKEKDVLDSVNGVPEGSIPVGVIHIIPNIDKLIDTYENYEDGVIDYDEYYTKLIDDPDEDLACIRVYADKDGKIYSCLSQNGEYKLIEKSFDEFMEKYQTYKFNLNKNEFTINRYYNSRNGIDSFSDPYNTHDTKFHTTYKLDSNDIITVGFFYDRFINSQTSCTFNPEAAGDDEPTDFPITYDSHKRVEDECIEHGVDKPVYPKLKVVELIFHKTEMSSNSVYLSNLTYVFALNESLDKPFMTVDVKNGEVTDIKFNDTIKESYTDPEEYDETLHDHIADEDDVYNESWVDFKNGVHPSSGLMFHVSLKNDMDGKTITPQLPSYITDGGKLDDNYQEDTKTKRLCVSPSIEGCMIAILNYKKIREHVGDKFYVYTPERPFSQYKHKTNKEIVKDKLVFDANITKEAWILEPCKLKLYGIIKLKKVKDLKKKPTVEKGIKMNTIKLDYEWIMTPKASGKFNKAIGDSPDEESDKKEKPINEYAVPGSFYDDIKPHPGGVYALVEDDSYRSHFCHIDFQGHDNKYLGWNAPTGSELILKTQEVIKSEKWEFRKSETDTVIPEYTHIFTYAQQILPIIRLDKIKDRLNELLAPHCPLTVHDPNSDTDIEYVCIQPQQYEVIDKKQTSYVYDTAYKHMFENHIVYLPIVDNLGMFEVKHTTHVAGTYDDNLFFEELFYGPTISYKLFDAFKDLNSVTLYDISDINAWDFACGYEDHYDEDGERIEPGDPKHPSNKSVTESTNVLVPNDEFFMEANKNYEKALKILDYDPKTNTIKGNIPLPDGSTKERVLFVINSPIVNGACVASLDFYKNDLENKIRESEPGSKERNELEKHKELINNASRGKKDYEEFIVCMPRKNLKERNIGGVVSAMHEVGHVNYWCNTSKNNQQKARDFINKNKIDELTYNGPNHEHAIDSDEYLADDFAAKRTSKHASKKHISKLSLNELQKIYGEVKHRRKQLDVLKSKINPSKFEKDENAYLDALEKTYILMDEVEQLEDQLSKAYDLPKTPENETILNRVKKEYINLKNKQARTNESKDSKLNVVVMNERLNENIKSFEKSIDEILYNIQSIKTEYNKRKEFVDKDLIKNVQESCLMDNEEFFMEVSKYERRLNKQFQREYEKAPTLAKYDYVGNEKQPRNSDKYTRERINRVTQQRKDYEKASNIENSSVKRRNSSNKNKLKALKLLDYDPKTNTIKGNITLPDGSKKKRVPYIIENEVARNMGPFVGTIDEVRSMFDSIDFTNDKKPSSTELSRRQKVLNTLDQFEKNGEKFVIMIPRKFLNQRHLAGAGASLHELGHFTYIHDPNQSEETERAKAFRDSIKDKLTENTPSYMHLVKNPMGDISATYGIDESNEFSADKYAADRIGIKNYERMLKKLIKFGKKATNKAVISQINATETQLNLLKSSNGDSNYKDILNYIKGSAETFSRWSNEAQESVVQYKSKIKDLDKNIADINRKINEFKDHTSEISDELKELYKALESAKDERDSAVEELKSKRESAKSNTDSADKLFNNASFAAQYKALKASINNFKKWMDDYDVELNERINYIKKYHEKKNIGESCLIMDNDEFFGLTE